MYNYSTRRKIENRRKTNSRRGKASAVARFTRRIAEAEPHLYAMTVRVYRLGVVRQVILHTDGLYVWHQGGKTRTYEAFCRAMNRKLWSRAKETRGNEQR